MSPKRPFAIPPDLGAAIAGLPDGDPAGRRTRAIARLLRVGPRPQETVDLDVGDLGPAYARLSWPNPPSVRAAGRKCRVVQFHPATAAEVVAYLEDRQGWHRAVAPSDSDSPVTAVSVKAGSQLRVHRCRTLAAIRTETTTEEDRRRARRGPEGSDAGRSP